MRCALGRVQRRHPWLQWCRCFFESRGRLHYICHVHARQRPLVCHVRQRTLTDYACTIAGLRAGDCRRNWERFMTWICAIDLREVAHDPLYRVVATRRSSRWRSQQPAPTVQSRRHLQPIKYGYTARITRTDRLRPMSATNARFAPRQEGVHVHVQRHRQRTAGVFHQQAFGTAEITHSPLVITR
jgi:hypothetical protein